MTLFKYCPHCKSKNLTEKGRHNRCKDCNYELYFAPPPAVGVFLFNTKNELLFGRKNEGHKKGLWTVPGGFVDFYETLEEAARRETYEETNIKIQKIRYFKSYTSTYIFSEVTYYPVCAIFVGTFPEKQIKNLKGNDDLDDLQFFSKDKIPFNTLAYTDIAQGLEDYFRH